jgi:hypothetical protein
VLFGLTSQRVSLFQLRRYIGGRKISKGVVDRLFDLEHHTRPDQIEAALEAVGKRLTVGVQDLAAQSVLLTCIADRLKPVASYTRKFDAVYHSTCP